MTVLHQGMKAYDATFWAGANAVIRRRVLEDIVEVETVGGHAIRTYIHDRTVIEDTESSVDIAAVGKRLVNDPERLSDSATPPDFGSLVVQRRLAALAVRRLRRSPAQPARGRRRAPALRRDGPVNLAGVLKSVRQPFSGEKIPFVRTPKVRNRDQLADRHGDGRRQLADGAQAQTQAGARTGADRTVAPNFR